MVTITRTYLGGCTWCNATGQKFPMQHNGTDFSSLCPVCNGAKTIPVTETFESDVVTATDDICDLCGRKMKAQNKEFVEYECMNTKCDAYCKIRPVKKANFPLTDINRG